MSHEIVLKIKLKRLTPGRGAEQANAFRNVIMDAKRGETSAIGLALARNAKAAGKSLTELEIYYADKLFKTEFVNLSKEQRDKVWFEIVKAAGRDSMKWSNIIYWLDRGGRAVFAITVIVTVYDVMHAQSPGRTLVQDGAEIGGAIAGSAALGPVGFALGPWSIVAVPFLAFIGALTGAYGIQCVFDRLWGPE